MRRHRCSVSSRAQYGSPEPLTGARRTSRARGISEAFKEEFRIKHLHKAEKELLVVSHGRAENVFMTVDNLQGGTAMTKADMVAKLAEETKVTKKVAAAMLESLVRPCRQASRTEVGFALTDSAPSWW